MSVVFGRGRVENVCSLSNCGEYRRLILSHHSSKAFVGLIKVPIDSPFCKGTSVTQHDAVASRGTDVAHHAVQGFRSVAGVKKWNDFCVELA